MDKRKLSQLHTTIDSNLMNKFKNLCKNYNIGTGTGVKLLISKSINKKVLPGMQKKPSRHYANLGAISGHMNTPVQKKKVIRNIERVTDYVIPMLSTQPLFFATIERAYLQQLLIAIAVDRPVLQRYYVTDKTQAHWPRTTNEYLFLASQFIVSGQVATTKIHWNTLADAFSLLLSNQPECRKKIESLRSITLLPPSIIGPVKVAVHWYVMHYVYHHIQAYKANKMYTQIDLDKTGAIISDTYKLIREALKNQK